MPRNFINSRHEQAEFKTAQKGTPATSMALGPLILLPYKQAS